MSRIEGKEYRTFVDTYNEVLMENPSLECRQHEIATFCKLFVKVVQSFDSLKSLCDNHDLKEFAWQMWKYGFAYDYPEDPLE